jgi:hypothetical protein
MSTCQRCSQRRVILRGYGRRSSQGGGLVAGTSGLAAVYFRRHHGSCIWCCRPVELEVISPTNRAGRFGRMEKAWTGKNALDLEGAEPMWDILGRFSISTTLPILSCATIWLGVNCCWLIPDACIFATFRRVVMYLLKIWFKVCPTGGTTLQPVKVEIEQVTQDGNFSALDDNLPQVLIIGNTGRSLRRQAISRIHPRINYDD